MKIKYLKYFIPMLAIALICSCGNSGSNNNNYNNYEEKWQSKTFDISHNYNQYINISKSVSGNGYVWDIVNISGQTIEKIDIRYTIYWEVSGMRQERHLSCTVHNLSPGESTESLIGQQMQMYSTADAYIEKIIITL